MEIIILVYWGIFNISGAWLEYLLYKKEDKDPSFLYTLIRKIIFPLVRLICSFVLVYYYLHISIFNEMILPTLGLYLISTTIYYGTLFQLRRWFYGEEDYHFFSHSYNNLINLRNESLIDFYAAVRLLFSLIGGYILFF